MKNIFKIMVVSLFLTYCDYSPSKSSIKSIELELRQKKEEKTIQIENIKKEIEALNSKIDNTNNDKKSIVISTTTVSSAKFDHFLEFQGSVKTDKNIVVYPEVSGILKNIYVHRGEYVKKGTLIAELENGVLNFQLQQLKLQTQLLKTIFERKERLWNQKIGSEIQYLETKTKYLSSEERVKEILEVIKKTKVYAQFSGFIDDIIANKGSNLSPGITPILRLVNIDEIYIESEIPEKHISKIKKGSKVKLNLPILNAFFESEISQVGNFIKPSNRSFKIEVMLPNPDKILKPNMVVKILINDYTNENALMVPIKNVLEDSKGSPYVFKIIKDEKYKILKTKKTFIELGKSSENKIEIKSGLRENDQIVHDGLRLIHDDQIVKVLNSF